jgi:hypothetical protein
MRALLCALCLALASGCLAPPEETPPTIALPPPPPPPPPPLRPPPPPPPQVDACGRGTIVDPGGHGGFPGSGLGEDGGTGQLWLVRVDRGLANLADSIQLLVERTTYALGAAGLSTRGIAVVSLYGGDLIWSTLDARTARIGTLATALRARTAFDNPLPSGCATSQLLRLGPQLSDLGGQPPFSVRPGALLVALVDHGTRPVALTSCGNPAAALGADPACWAAFRGTVLPRAQLRFALFATPETGTTADLRTRCAGVPGLPLEAIDALAPSTLPYYDPLAAQIDQGQPDLATRFDLCRAIGSDAPAALATFASAWAPLLVAQP